MPLAGRLAPPNKRKKTNRIVTDLSHVTQYEFDSEPEASEFDLGPKVKTPKDIMLEELSLMGNKGSKMFRMRQKRVERFIHENNPDLFNNESMSNLGNLVPSLGGQMMDAEGNLVGKKSGGTPPVPPPKPGSKGAGEGGKSYVSPWENAMNGNDNLKNTLKSKMHGPHIQQDLPIYKSFNRSAVPFGGFEKANQLMTFQLPDIESTKEVPEPAVVYQSHSSRPSFNRTPIGWMGSSEPTSLHMEKDTVPFDGETDDL